MYITNLKPMLLLQRKGLASNISKLHGIRSLSSLLNYHENENSQASSRPKFKPSQETLPNFNDTACFYDNKTTSDLLRALLVFKLCQVPLIVRNAGLLLENSNRFLGVELTNKLLKHTVFAHFCGGEQDTDTGALVSTLKEYGIGGILDYAAESDVGSNVDKCNITIEENKLVDADESQFEETCDRHKEIFLSCIRTVKKVAPDGFAAIKLTALGNPILLERWSTAITEIKNLFEKFDEDRDGIISREEFIQGYREHFIDEDNDLLEKYVDHFFHDAVNGIDYISWCQHFKPSELPSLVSKCRDAGTLALACPSDIEIKEMNRLLVRVEGLVREAAALNVRIFIDAEQSYMQPAIDSIALQLQEKYNSLSSFDHPIVFNTYQTYLTNSKEKLQFDIERSTRMRYHFGAKLVRGAYLEGERSRALLHKYSSPIHDTIEDTHSCFDECVQKIMMHHVSVGNKQSPEVVLATHNQKSIELALQAMKDLKISKHENTIRFAQLLGMSDNLTFALAKQRYKSYKYIPYGEVSEVLPYLLRRLEENSNLFGNVSNEINNILREVQRRFVGSLY